MPQGWARGQNLGHLKKSFFRVAMVREKSLEIQIFSRSGKSQGISILVREIKKKVGKVREFENFQKSSLLKGF